MKEPDEFEREVERMGESVRRNFGFLALFVLGVLHLLGRVKFDWQVLIVFSIALLHAIAPLFRFLRLSKDGVEFEMAVSNASREKVEELAGKSSGRLPSNFDAMTPEAKRVLKSLWHFQKNLYAPEHSTRWGFAVGQANDDYTDFLSGVGFLIARDLVVTDLNRMVYLKNEGIDFCQKNDLEIDDYPLHFREFRAT